MQDDKSQPTEPRGCPIPGACSALIEIERLRRSLSDIATMADWHPDGATVVYAQNRAREALKDGG
jgi:hypothetical protein